MRRDLLPRPIAPENVEVGDKVRITHRPDDGVTLSYSGVVGRREDHGDTRHMLTVEGGRLFVWSVKRDPRITIELLDRAPVEQPMLFLGNIGDSLDEVRERVAS